MDHKRKELIGWINLICTVLVILVVYSVMIDALKGAIS